MSKIYAAYFFLASLFQKTVFCFLVTYDKILLKEQEFYSKRIEINMLLNNY